ncbi:MAG TPA: hypothetical protein VMV57_08945 [Terracidiphilus sp.]|nr:hypothetical protein [Terracidiphilus sp.]
MRETIEIGDLIKVSGEVGLWTVVAARVRNLEPKFLVQLGEDPESAQWFHSDSVTLLQKASTPEPMPEPMPSPMFETILEPMPEPIFEPMSEPTPEPTPEKDPGSSWMGGIPHFSAS